MYLSIAEWSGSALGLIGAFLVATHSRFSRLGWIAFILANLAMIVFALGHQHWGLLLQQSGFFGTSLLGLRRSSRLAASRTT